MQESSTVAAAAVPLSSDDDDGGAEAATRDGRTTTDYGRNAAQLDSPPLQPALDYGQFLKGELKTRL